MKKLIWCGVLSICVILSGCKQNKTSDNIRIGAAIALTGFGADFGQSENNAIKLLKEKYGEDSHIEFFIEDTQSDVKSGINAIKKLINIDKCDIVYCELSSIVDASASIIRKSEVTMIAPVYLENLKENPYAIRNLPSADQENTELINYLINSGIVYDRIGILYSNDVFGQTCYNSFKSLMPKKSVLCHSSAINDDALRETALKAISDKPDVLYLGSMSESLGLLVKFLRQNGYDKEIITTDAFSYNYINSLAGEYAKGVRYVDFKDSEQYKSFRDYYLEKCGIECVPTAMLCYDGISAIVSATIEGKDYNGTSYNGLTGVITIDNNEIIYPIQVLTWE